MLQADCRLFLKELLMCRKSLRCLHHRLRKISLQDLKRRIAVQTAVRLHRVIEINKAAQLLSPVFRTVVGVNALNQVWTGINQVSGQKLGGAACGFVRQNGRV